MNYGKLVSDYFGNVFQKFISLPMFELINNKLNSKYLLNYSIKGSFVVIYANFKNIGFESPNCSF